MTSWPRTARFQLIRDMNETLGDSRSYDIFVELESRHSDEALCQSWRALPVLVQAGDFTRADRYCGDPLEQLAYVNQLSKKLLLVAPHPLAPRLAAELGNLVQHARLATEILAGLGRTDEATALHAALIEGLESEKSGTTHSASSTNRECSFAPVPTARWPSAPATIARKRPPGPRFESSSYSQTLHIRPLGITLARSSSFLISKEQYERLFAG